MHQLEIGEGLVNYSAQYFLSFTSLLVTVNETAWCSVHWCEYCDLNFLNNSSSVAVYC